MSRPALLVPVVVFSLAAFAATGCGGGDSSSSDDSSSAAVSETSSGGSATTTESPSLDEVLACLQGEGIDAQDQSSNTSGETIGIDYSGGRTTISFEKTAEDAEATAMVAEDYGKVLSEGTIVASLDTSPEAAADAAAIKTCISG